MGKNKKDCIEQKSGVNKDQKDYKEDNLKNTDDNCSKKDKSKENTNINKFNFEYNRIEEKYNNKFDIHFPKVNYIKNIYNPRKESKDSTNDSFSCEEYFEEHNYINTNNNHNASKNQLNLQKKNEKRQGQFKSTAADFKIKYKTELCKYYEINGTCKYGDKCAYAHGKENLRSKVTNSSAYRTRKCVQFFENGYCPYGSRCQFAHQLSTNIINNPYNRKMSYKSIIETISKFENIENIKTLIEKPRLGVFQEIYDEDNFGQSRLLNDIKNLYRGDIIERVDRNSL